MSPLLMTTPKSLPLSFTLANNISANRLTHAVTLQSRFQLVYFSGFINGCETCNAKVIFGLTISTRHSSQSSSCSTHFPSCQSSSCSYRNRGPLNQRCSLVTTLACSPRDASSAQFKSVETCRHCLGLDFWYISDIRLAKSLIPPLVTVDPDNDVLDLCP